MQVVKPKWFHLSEPWFSVDEKEPIAYAIVEVIEAADLKPADLNGLWKLQPPTFYIVALMLQV